MKLCGKCRISSAKNIDTGRGFRGTLRKGLGEPFTPDVEAAWSNMYATLASEMQVGRERRVKRLLLSLSEYEKSQNANLSIDMRRCAWELDVDTAKISIILTMNEEDRILDLDGEWNEAYSRLDCAVLDRIIADDWVCIDGAGLVITKSELLTRVASNASFLDPYKFDEIALRVFGEAAIVTGRLSGQMRDSDGTHDVNQRYMRVYVKRNERWQAVATQVTKIKETFLS